ncbi:MAG: PaaI family thioesterase [Rhodospirillales bacterium]|jgi:uncharacterized protein (TIGR00369 family)|nr:PaaI family thioesterase [Rhodospirillales bacterium]
MLKVIAELKAANAIERLNEVIPYAATIGLAARREDGALISVLAFRESNIGNYVARAIHGGVVGALLEHAAILQVLAETETQVLPKIVNLSVDYLRPCLAADTFARGRVIRQGRRVANVRVEAWQDSPERPVAAAHAHFLLT